MRRAATVLALLAALLAAGLWFGRRSPVTFHRDIAPIIHGRCAPCHHPGGPAPFALTGYAEVRKRADQIVDVTRRRLMPPWMPEPGCGEFVDDRSLSQEQIALIGRWAGAGAPEGDAAGARAWTPGGSIGEPDLVVALPEPYALPAEGRDLYRNFVVPIPLAERRFVRAVEFRPGNPRAIHHAFLFLDPTRESLRRDEQDPGPGFPGLHVPSTAQAPPGHFLSWQPGKRLLANPEDLAWPLARGMHLVMQLHLRPTGKPESLRPSVGFFFTDRAPTRTPAKIGLWSYDIDIPAGAREHKVRDSVTLATEVEVLRILPHAHYLGKRLEAVARLPDGTEKTLLRIPSWDFNWQGDYAYAQPVVLPQGTRLTMVWTYDNSAENPRNPNLPPRPVRYGLESADEMAELWLQVVPRGPDGARRLEREAQPKVIQAAVSYNRYLLGLDAGNARAQSDLGKALLFQGDRAAARRHLDEAIRLRPDIAEAHYVLGLLHRLERRLDEAKASFREAIRHNPDDPKAHGNLGLVLMEQGELDGAAAEFETALRLDPSDEIARTSLAEIRAKKP